MKYKYYLFDLDGVIANTDNIQYNSTREAIIKIKNFDISQHHEINKYFLSTITTIEKLNKLYENNIITYDEINIIYIKKKEIADTYFNNLNIDNKKIELCNYLKNNDCKIAIVTNGNKDSAAIILNKIGIMPFIDLLITNNDVINKKPHSEPYIRAMMNFNGTIEEYLIFEDSECGLISAKGTGCKVIHIKSVEDLCIDFIKKIL